MIRDVFMQIYVNNNPVLLRDAEREEIYSVRSFKGDFKIFEAFAYPDNLIASIDGVDTKYGHGVPSEEFYSLWFFKDGSCAIQRRKEKGWVFVSEIWELRNAAKRLKLELITKN